MHLRTFALKALLFSALLFPISACGGSSGGGGSNGGGTEMVTEFARSDLDGYATSDVTRDTIDGIRCGDQENLAPTREARGFVTWDLPVLPAGAEIQSVVIRLYQVIVVGDPFTSLGNILVDEVNYGATLDGVDFDIAAIKANIGILSTNIIEGYKSLEVTNRVIAAYRDGLTAVQFRIRFNTAGVDGDTNEDTVRFEDGDNTFGTGKLPDIEITYNLP